MKTPDTLVWREELRYFEEHFMPRLNFAPKFRKFPIQGECWVGGDCHIAGKYSRPGSFPTKYHGCILHLMKNAAKMTVVNAVKMMARAEMHFSWENFGISNLIKFDILHIFAEHDDDENDQMVVLQCNYGNSCARLIITHVPGRHRRLVNWLTNQPRKSR